MRTAPLSSTTKAGKGLGLLVALILLCSLSLIDARPAAANSPAWWNVAYAQRAQLTLTSQDALPNSYTVSVQIPHATWVASGMSLANGNDIRVARWSGSAWTEIDRIVDPHSAWNASSTQLWFRTQTTIAASTSDTSYWIYYANSAAASPPANDDNVFSFYDDFSSGSINGSKWNSYPLSGGSVGVSNGQAVFSGTTDGSNLYNYTGLETAIGFDVGYIAESDFSIVTQSTNAQTFWKGQFGATDTNITIWSDNNADKRVGYYDSGWIDSGDSALDSQTFASQRVETAVDEYGHALLWENGTLKGDRWSADTNSTTLYFAYSPNSASETFEVRFDNVMIRKYTQNEPTVSITGLEATSGSISVSATIPPALTFSVGGRAAGTTCNGATSDSASTATEIVLGGPSPSANRTAANDLHIATNAAGGYTLFVRYSGPATSGAHTLADWAGTNAAPTAWTGVGTEALGYTTDAAVVSGGTTDRFVNGGTKWAGLSSTFEPIAYSVTPADATTCIAYRAGATATTAAGLYSTSAIVTAIPNF